jgi:hypothetical protein
LSRSDAHWPHVDGHYIAFNPCFSLDSIGLGLRKNQQTSLGSRVLQGQAHDPGYQRLESRLA